MSSRDPKDGVPLWRRISTRTAMLSWAVAALTVALFASFAFSAARRTFLSALEAKAGAVASAVNDVAAKNLPEGNPSRVQQHCQNLLGDDDTLAYIAVTYSNNVAVVYRASAVTTNSNDPAWTPTDIEEGIRRDPQTDIKVFNVVAPLHGKHSARWVSIGLSLRPYYEGMRRLYFNFAWITLLCLTVALFTSIYYARRLVRPVRELRKMVAKVTDGDLSARAKIISRDEVGELAASLNTMTEKLEFTRNELLVAKEAAESASVAKSKFFATISHEIRTPINGVIGMLKLIKDSPLDKRQTQQVNTAIVSARALLSVIEGILDFSKIEAGKLEIEKINFDLFQILDSALMMFNERASEKKIALTKKIGSGIPQYLKGDPNRISQILINLISNAIKFTSTGGITTTVHLQSKTEDRLRIYFAVTDTGIGITKEQQDRLFKPFSQADSSTTRRYGGTGLGLAICKQLIELMGGEININSEAGAGTTFWFVLPFEYGQAPAEPLSEELATATVDGSKQIKASILVAEDNNINAYVTRELLLRLGYACDVVENGSEAVRAFTVKDYDLILMDIQMPIMDGFEATKIIREKERHRPEFRVPIVALTANAMSGDKERCIAGGMDDHLAKPLDPEQMDRTIQRLLRPNRKPAPGLIGREPVNYDEILQRCMKDGNLANQLLDEFIVQARTTVTELRTQLAAGDAEALHRTSHRLKGTAATLACEHIRRIAAIIENIARERGSLRQRVPELINELEGYVRDVANWRVVKKEKELLDPAAGTKPG